jgi:hypothetical protein
MTTLIQMTIKGRGPRGFQKQISSSRKAAWTELGAVFHARYRDKRFTPEHAREAGYHLRKGEGQTKDSKAFRASYTGRKQRIHGHTNPLEFSGRTRAAVRLANVQAFALKVQVKYPGAKTFNFRHPKSRINMREEFVRITTNETQELGVAFNKSFETQMARHKNEAQ